jgi:hypothetical protein
VDSKEVKMLLVFRRKISWEGTSSFQGNWKRSEEDDGMDIAMAIREGFWYSFSFNSKIGFKLGNFIPWYLKQLPSFAFVSESSCSCVSPSLTTSPPSLASYSQFILSSSFCFRINPPLNTERLCPLNSHSFSFIS